MTFRWIAPVLVALAAMLHGGSAESQEFPGKIVRLVVPYPPGGGVDGLARAFTEPLSRRWGQTVLVENKPGASTMIGGADVARSPADGHTLFFTTDSSITSNPHLFKKMMYDPIKELTGVTQLIDLHQLVLVHPSVTANTLQELVALAKAQPDKLNYGSYGVGSQPHLLFEMLQKETGIKIQQVSYRGIAPAITAVIAGDVQMTLGGVSVAAGHIASGRLKPLALGRATREKTLPGTPTLKEAGFPGIDPRSWFGLFAPAGTPPVVVAKIQRDVAAVLNDPQFKARFIDSPGFTGVGSTPEAFAKFIEEDFAYKKNLISVTGITAD